jgi:hypothetical protein
MSLLSVYEFGRYTEISLFELSIADVIVSLFPMTMSFSFCPYHKFEKIDTMIKINRFLILVYMCAFTLGFPIVLRLKTKNPARNIVG